MLLPLTAPPTHEYVTPLKCRPRPSCVNALYRWSVRSVAFAAFPLQPVGIVVKTEGQYKNRVEDNRASKGASGNLSIGSERLSPRAWGTIWEPCVGWTCSFTANRQTEEAWFWDGVQVLRCCPFMCFCGACGCGYVRFGYSYV